MGKSKRESEKAEREKELVKQVFVYLSEGRYHGDPTTNEKRVIRKKAKKFEIQEGVLYYENVKRGSKTSNMVRYILEDCERSKILKACHTEPTSGHMGVKRTLARITERFYWPGVAADVHELVTTCDVCQKGNRKVSTITPELHPIPVKSPWYHIGIDYIGPFSPTSARGNRYILTISDYFTKWVDAIPLPSKRASVTANALFKIFMKMGIPRVVTSDQGSEFRNKLNKKISSLLNIKHHLTTAYHPQANGLDERFNQTIQTMIAKFVESKEDWDEYLEICVFAYNTSRHESTTLTPFELQFGRKAYLPVDVSCSPESHLKKWLTSKCDVETLTQKRQQLFETAKSKIKSAQKKQKYYYDLKHVKSSVFSVGTKVLLKDFRRKKRRGGKLDRKWTGPYKIQKHVGKGVYWLSSLTNPTIKIKRAIGSHLKPYHSPKMKFSSMESLSSSVSRHQLSCDKSSHVHPVSSKLEKSYDASSDSCSPPDMLSPDLSSGLKLSQNVSPHPSFSRQLFGKSHRLAESDFQPGSPVLSVQERTFHLQVSPDGKPPLLSNSQLSIDETEECESKGFCTSSPIKEAGFFPDFCENSISPVYSPTQDFHSLNKSNAETKSKFSDELCIPKKHLLELEVDEFPQAKRPQFSQKYLRSKKQSKIGSFMKPKCPEKKTAKKKSATNNFIDNFRVRDLHLTEKDKRAILEGDWLTDNHVNAFNSLVSHQFPAQNGFQCPLILSEFLKYDSGKENLNLSRKHWVCISNIFCAPGVVEIFDSLPSCSLDSFSLKLQVAAILQTTEDSFLLRHVQVQRQVGTNDCALFAMAFALSLCYGEDPFRVTYSQVAMRQHFTDCCTKKHLVPFPTSSESRRLARTRKLRLQEVSVFCVCRLPWNRNFDQRGSLVVCSMCKKWYHESCMNISKRIIDQPLLKYICSVCLDLSAL